MVECADGADEAATTCRALGKTQPCLTVGGPDPLERCVFPFTYRGERFNACALDDSSAAWCPTRAGGFSSFAHSGLCGPGCPVESARRFDRDACKAEALEVGEEWSGGPLHCAPPPAPPPAPPEPPPPPSAPPPWTSNSRSTSALWLLLATLLLSCVVSRGRGARPMLGTSGSLHAASGSKRADASNERRPLVSCVA